MAYRLYSRLVPQAQQRRIAFVPDTSLRAQAPAAVAFLLTAIGLLLSHLEINISMLMVMF